MTCATMGGPCGHEMTAETAEEMNKLGGEHLKTTQDEAHMKMAADMKASTPEAMETWKADFMKKWDATPTEEAHVEAAPEAHTETPAAE